MAEFKRKCFHAATVCFLVVIIIINIYIVNSWKLDTFQTEIVDFPRFGILITSLLYLVRIVPVLLLLPVTISNLIGLVCFNTQHDTKKFKTPTIFAPFIRFRIIVNNSAFPEYIRETTNKNIQTCLETGLKNFIFDIVTERSLELPPSSYLRELLVPSDYQTTKCASNKAKALQYYLDVDVNIFSESDWIVHLGEQTIMTSESAISIVNFVYDNRYPCGQGIITCLNNQLNLVSVISDSCRVAMDYGLLRFSLGILHRPIFGVKSSFFVCNATVQKKIGFDNDCPEELHHESIMALKAWQRGFKFDFIDAKMVEPKTEYFRHCLYQKHHGFRLASKTVLNADVPLIYKLGLFTGILNSLMMQIALSCLILGYLFPLSGMTAFNVIYGVIFGTTFFMFIFGAMETHQLKESGLWLFLFLKLKLVIASVVIVPYALLIETMCVYWSLLTRQKHVFKNDNGHIV